MLVFGVRIELLLINMITQNKATECDPHHYIVPGYSIEWGCQCNDAHNFLSSLDGSRQFNAILQNEEQAEVLG